MMASAGSRFVADADMDIELWRAGGPTYLQKYQSFIAAAANHMTLLAPFIPMRSQLLSH